MYEILEWFVNLQTNVKDFFDFDKGGIYWKIIKCCLYYLLLLAATGIFLEVLSLFLQNQALRTIAQAYMWLVLLNIVILPGFIIISIDKVSGLNLLINYKTSFLEQCKTLTSEWNSIIICFITIIVSVLLFHTINIIVEKDRSHKDKKVEAKR